IAVLGDGIIEKKFINECKYVNGVQISNDEIEAIYIVSTPNNHYEQIKKALKEGKHVLCESPIATKVNECKELFEIAERQNCILMEAIKTAYSTAYSRLLLLVKSGAIGNIISIDSTCTSMRDDLDNLDGKWNSISAWGPTALLPIFQLLGTDYIDKHIVSHYIDEYKKFDGFTKIDFIYPHAVASIKVAKSAKSEGELVITGTKGYVYVPSPWWKTDYFEIRYENPQDNKRYFYQLEGEGIRYEIVAFNNSIQDCRNNGYIDKNISIAISKIMEDCQSSAVIEI
ncbi:Gfo/Idh/MocA family oxidoreductase, partial [uncultured Clostridium sp.]|uniref:Gfo/Idh/MocA family protein n=1 Tax=uncultured Clostridium sp. TaxID=59620 RepID=UPI0025D2DD12